MTTRGSRPGDHRPNYAAGRPPGRSKRKVESVAGLTARLRAIMDSNFARVSVRGEVSDLKRASSGHVYFTLKDRSATIDAVVWRSRVPFLPRTLQAGVGVVAHGSLDVYPPRGSYSLVIVF